MPGWQGSDRLSRLPKNWPTIRKRIKRRDGNRCTHRDIYGVRCNGDADEVDHIVPGDDHSDENLRSLCHFHHGQKSGREGAAARAAIRRKNDRKFRRSETHPGLV